MKPFKVYKDVIIKQNNRMEINEEKKSDKSMWKYEKMTVFCTPLNICTTCSALLK